MPSFLDKLKKGMDIDEETIEKDYLDEEETAEGIVDEKPKKIKERKNKKTKKKSPILSEEETIKVDFEESVPEASLSPEPEEPIRVPEAEIKDSWAGLNGDDDGELAIDIYQTPNDFVILSAIGGVESKDLDIAIEKDMITIRGARPKPIKEDGDYYFSECHWGSFSREIILPEEIETEKAAAEMKGGILTIRLPRILKQKEKNKKIVIKS